MLSACAEGPPTLVHNDCRLDNLFFAARRHPVLHRLADPRAHAAARRTSATCWPGAWTSEDLAANWEGLLRRYHDRLIAGGVSGYSFDECVENYRQNVIYPLGAGMALIGIMDIGDGRGLGDAIVVRCLKHIADLDSFAAL